MATVGRDSKYLDSGGSQLEGRIGSIFENRGVDLSQGARAGETPQQRLNRISQSVQSGQRTLNDVRQSVGRLSVQGRDGMTGRDRSILSSGDPNAVRSRIGAIFDNRDVERSFGAAEGETPRERMSRIANEVMSGQRSFDDVRGSVDRLAKKAAGSGQPASLPREVLQALAERRRLATRGFQEAQARAEQERGTLNARHEAGVNELGRRIGAERAEGMADLGARSQARNPRQAGRMVRDLRDERVRQTGQLEDERADRLRALDQMVNEARRSRDREHAAVDADKARASTELDRLFTPNFGGQ